MNLCNLLRQFEAELLDIWHLEFRVNFQDQTLLNLADFFFNLIIKLVKEPLTNFQIEQKQKVNLLKVCQILDAPALELKS